MSDSNRVGIDRAGTFFREHPRARRSAIAVAVLGLLLIVLLIVTPMAAAWYVESWLRDNGAAGARIGNIDFNPFTATLRVEDLHAGGGADARLQVDLAEIDLYWWPLFSQRAHVETLRLVGVRADVVAGDGGSLKVGAVDVPMPPASARPASPTPVEEAVAWGVGSDLVDLRDVVVTYRQDIYDTEVHIRTVRLGSQYSWLGEESAELVLDMAVDGSPLTLRSDVAPWSDEPSLSGNLTLADVALADYASEAEALAGLQGLRGDLAMDLTLGGSLGSDGVLRLDISGPLNLDDGGFALPGLAAASHASLRWDGTLSLALPAPAGEPLLRVDGAVQLTGAGASVALAGSADGDEQGAPGGAQDPPLDVRLGDFRWRGQVAFAPAEDDGPPLITANGGVALRDLAVDRADLPLELLRLGGLNVRELAVGGIDDVTVGTIGLDGLSLLGAKGDADPAPVLVLAGLSASGLSFSGAAVALETVTLTDPAIAVVREANGDIARVTPLLAALQSEGGTAALVADEEPAEAAAPAADVAGDAAPLAIRVDRLRITAGDWLSFADRSVTPPADFALTELDVTLENIDTAAAEPMSVDLVTGDGRQTRLAVAGTVAAFAEQMGADLQVDLDNLELPPLSPYVPTYNIFRGRLSAESAVALAGEQLDVQNALTIERLQLAGKAGDQDDGVLAQGMAMPVDVALDLLRDRQDRIRLDLPVTGSLDNPNFGTGDIIRQATQRALQNAAMSYVKNALQPLGTLMLVGNLAAKAARPRFEPIEMAPGETELPDQGEAYLDKLGGMLAERPGLRLTICGVATAADREVLAAEAAARLEEAPGTAADVAEPGAAPAPGASTGDAEAVDEGAGEVQPPAVSPAELLELAQLRTTRVISYLSSREGVDRERLFLCRESIEDDADAAPRVEITL
jgi:hypothetical protein